MMSRRPGALTAPAILAVAAFLALAAAAPARASLSLVWHDEFDGATLNTADWSYDIGDGCPNLCGWGNNELQYYRSQNVTLSGGNLVITAKQESIGGRSYTSGKIHTRDKQSFLYGRMEMRAKLPVGGGMWPAFWMMPQDDAYGGWAASGEIDIMEAANDMNVVGGTIHYGGTWPANTYANGSYAPGGSFADDFHVYAVEWEPTVIRWYVDDVLYTSKTSSLWYSDGAPGNPLAPFDQPFYIILNAAVGGNYTGCTDPGCITASFPQQYLIDYVRVYQDTPNAAPTVTVTAPADGAVLPAGDIAITADADDSDGTVATVEFYNGATYLGADAAAPYAFTWTGVTDGCYEITAKAIDDEGAFTTDTVEVSVGLGCGQLAYPSGVPPTLPAVIQAEDYDQGGESVAYHDLTVANEGGQYRTGERVDIEACSDVGGGYNVGWLRVGEWMEYTVNVPVAGTYPLEIRVASQSAGGAFRIEFGGVDKTGSVTVPVTGAWQNWTTVTASATLEAGVQVMRFVPTVEGYNLNSIAVNAVSAAPDLQGARPVLRPCRPNPFNPSTTIGYELPQAATVELDVYDVAGHRVRRLVAGERQAAGVHQAVWDGRGDDGRLAAAGVYLCRLQAGGLVDWQRMALLK